MSLRPSRHPGRALLVLVAAAVLGGAGCARTTTPSARRPSPVLQPSVTSPLQAQVPTSTPSAARPGRYPDKVLVVVLENHSDRQALGQMPYLASQARRYGVATDYRALTHPSLPNYLAIAGGSTFGVRDDAGPGRHPLGGSSVFGQAWAHGRTGRTYAESMPRACGSASTSTYAVKHNPWAYFTAERARCRAHDVPSGTPAAGALRADVAAGRLPNVGMLVPDICHDGHDCSLRTADTWLRGWLPVLTAGPDFRLSRLAVVVTFDEDDGSAANRVLTVVIASPLHGRVVKARLSHLALSHWLSDVAGAPPLRDAGSVGSLGAAFGLEG